MPLDRVRHPRRRVVTLAQGRGAFQDSLVAAHGRYVPPWLGRRRGLGAWFAQVALFAVMLALAGVGHRPETPWVVARLALALAFASGVAGHRVDAYAVEVLHPEEQGAVRRARDRGLRAALFVSGGLSISLAARWSWPAVNASLALIYLGALVVTRLAPEPSRHEPPPTTLRGSRLGAVRRLLARHRALEMLAFVLTTSSRPARAGAHAAVPHRHGLHADDRGYALATVGSRRPSSALSSAAFGTTLLASGTRSGSYGFLRPSPPSGTGCSRGAP